MRSILLAVVGALLCLGCFGTDSGNPPGPAECTADADCEDACLAFVDEAAPRAASAHQITGASCEMIAIVGETEPAPGCACAVGEGAISLVGGGADPCLYYARDRSCLYARDELPVCSVDDPASCDAVCDELQARLDADAQRALDVEVRLASCHAPGLGSRCECVLRVDEHCFVGAALTSYDCALSDAAILERHPDPAPPVYPPCSAVDMSASAGGTCIDDSDPNAEICLYPRAAEEWQGMLVNMCLRALCETSARCGLAAACLPDGMCGPCARDADCAAGEACVLDHCLPADNVRCRSQRDCGGEHCLLSGLTGGTARSNEGLVAYCASDPSPPPRE